MLNSGAGVTSRWHPVNLYPISGAGVTSPQHPQFKFGFLNFLISYKKSFCGYISLQNGYIIIFICHENLTFLCKLETIYIDRTFSYCLKYFVQFFVIHGFINDYYVPLVFYILNNKSTDTYQLALSYIKNKAMQNFSLMFEPKYVTVDFESAIHLAVKSVWPLSEIISYHCRFHLTQAWYRKIQSLGLTSAHKDNNNQFSISLNNCRIIENNFDILNYFVLVFLPKKKKNNKYLFEIITKWHFCSKPLSFLMNA
ncbi:MULE domain-containing protein [Aphis craccivora]|uniref:MULE domain-containing protein n=1 Tax=Aphis craccivora TaxID=307492 RepID=A0A6G0VW87_APHCR|nr:MULE domain-containing protein [Aphis craccivora]